MAALHSPSTLPNPPQTFLDKKPPLLPRQSTSEVLSFTHIIANRLLPGQNVWDFFSPTPCRDLSAEADGQIISPQPLSPISPSFGQFPNANRRPSLAADAILAGQKHETPGMNGRHSTDAASTSHMITMMSSSLPPSPLTPSSLSNALTTSATAANATSTSMTTTTSTTITSPTPKLQKRRSFAQSLKSGMMNSAPLASTLYKMSSLLPAASKIRHYQEISGFFVAYFRSSGSFSCSSAAPLTKALPSARDQELDSFLTRQGTDEVKSRRASIQDTDKMTEEVRKKTSLQAETTALAEGTVVAGDGVPDNANHSAVAASLKTSPREQMIARGGSHHSLSSSTSSNSSTHSGNSGSSSSSSENSTVNLDLDREEIILSDSDEEGASKKELEAEPREQQQRLSSESASTAVSEPILADKPDVNSSAHASLSVHAFSLDTTWPVPRTLAQTFWFPFAHGIIYVVDATRKNDPRGMDHLVNARHFLASLIADPHFKRKDIPVVVFANKAGMDPETCYRVDEIAEILGCEEWEHDSVVVGTTAAAAAGGSGSGTAARPWCVKSTRSDGEGEGLRESVEWLKSRMGEIWKQ
ncbi:hypothetical protein BGZ70_010453 [Mortierella alpina]|uniref:Uncharacterized protein n=1 Tax=Mortierella alpina TaxID=64518 RepID=A0A9P6LZE5_MORAP|nr:hypothetical protein BGZ70_010453 [Mortierella alpina]